MFLKFNHKAIFNFALAGMFTFGLISCEEEAPPINFTPDPVALEDTTYISATPVSPGLKSVLIEDFTGVRCTNCPKAQLEVKKILDRYGDTAVAIAMHPNTPGLNIFTSPIDIDFRTQEAGEVLNLIGVHNGLPYGSVDRISNSADYLTWEGLYRNRKTAQTGVNLRITRAEIDAATNEFVVGFEAAYYNDFPGETHFYTIAFLESGIVNPQKDFGGEIPDYEHNHVLRQMPSFGAQLNSADNLVKNRIFKKEFRFPINSAWIPQNMELVIMVHKSLEVLNAKKADF